MHPRWYELFDLDALTLIELDSVREARKLELALRRPLREHKAPPPSTTRVEAAGVTEWVRGASEVLAKALGPLESVGHPVHRGRQWFVKALAARRDAQLAWALSQFQAWEYLGEDRSRAPQSIRDVLDAFAALGMDIFPRFSPEFLAWYQG